MTKSNNIALIKSKTKKGITSLLIREIIVKAISFVGQIVVFRIFRPEDFGVFAIIAFVVNFSDLFTDIGLTQSLIQKKKEPSEKVLSSVFIFRQTITVAVCILIIFAASLVTHYYRGLTESNVLMLQVFALTLLLRPLRSLFTIKLERKLDYHIIARVDIAGILSYQIVVVVFALLSFSVWSFIIAIFVKEIVEIAFAYYYTRWRPKFYLQLSVIKELAGYGIFMQAFGLQVFLHEAINPVIVGRLRGPYFVGLNEWSYNMVSVAKVVTDNYGRVAFASFSRLQEQKKELTSLVINSTNHLSIFVFYFIIILFVLGRDLVSFVFSEKWLPALPALYIFGIVIVINTLITPLSTMILALGKVKRMFMLSLLIIIVEWPLSYVLVTRMGFIGVSISALVAVLIATVGFLIILNEKAIVLSFMRTLLINLGFAISLVYIASFLFGMLDTNLVLLIIEGISLSLIYLGFIYIFFRENFNSYRRLFKESFLPI